jgi:tRNA/tmRNA/rRNA uracil-C5-methylase (TrmA/RlmC/RlmD family)
LDAVGVSRRPWSGATDVEVVASTVGDRAVVVGIRPGADVDVPELDVADVALLERTGHGRAHRRRGHRAVRERAVGAEFRVGAAGFWQVHLAAADALAEAVLAVLDPQPGERALDLYAGVGLFAAALAPRLGATGRVTVVESDREAARDAVYNLRDASPDVRVQTGRVDRLLGRVAAADVVVLDPPRAGAGAAVVRGIAALRPRSVAYVACDPAALARDLRTFADTGYRLAGLRAFDLFPMTHHVECVAALVRGGSPAAVMPDGVSSGVPWASRESS